MMKRGMQQFTGLALLLIMAGCWRTPAPAGWKYQVHPEVFAQGPTISSGAATKTADAGTSRTAVKIDPASAVGYENVPDPLKKLYGPSPKPLSEAEVIAQTLAHNRDLKIENYSLQIAETQIPISKSIYDLLLRADAAFVHQKSDTTTIPTTNVTTRNWQTDVSATQLLPSGALLQLAYIYGYLNQSPHPLMINPVISHGMTLTVSQPLLRGMGPKVTNANIHIAQLGEKISAAQFETLLQNQLAQAIDAYWNLVFAVRSYDVQVISYTAALDLLRVNSAKVKAGVMAPTDELQAKARAESRREAIIRVRQIVRDAEDRLKRTMFFQDQVPAWELELMPTQELTWREAKIDSSAVLTEALEQRPEIRAREAALSVSDLQLLKANDQLKPQLDLVGSAGWSGLDDHQGDAFEDFHSGDNDKESVGLQFRFPLQNRQARYAKLQRQLEKDRAMEEYQRQRDDVTFDVRQAVRGVKTARERIDISRSRVESETANLDSARKRFEVGVGTSFEVLQFQDNLASAQESYVQAIVDYNKSLNDLELARGTILKTYGVAIESPDLKPEDKPVLFSVGLN